LQEELGNRSSLTELPFLVTPNTAPPEGRLRGGFARRYVMAQVLCEVSEGLRAAEATVKLMTYENRTEYLPVDRGLLSQENGHHFLAVGLIHVNKEKHAALVSLPVEADSGAHRVWVKLDHLKLEQWATT
jgi:hypothetical protein